MAPKTYAAPPSPDVSSKVTVFLLTVGAPTYPKCLSALERQDCTFRFDIIRNVSPMSTALQEMINRCRTPFYIQVDEDMILKPHAIRTLLDGITKEGDRLSFLCHALWDDHLNRPILGVKIYRYDVFRKYPYQDVLSCEVDQLDRIRTGGHPMRMVIHSRMLRDDPRVLGLHGTGYTPESAFHRYRNLSLKSRAVPGNEWVLSLGGEFLHRIRSRETLREDDPDLWAFLGTVVGSVRDSTLPLGEKNYLTYKADPTLRNLYQLFNRKTLPQTSLSRGLGSSNTATLCMVADVPGWSFCRTARSLEKYHGTPHTWVTAYGSDQHGRKWLDQLPLADVYRFGGIHVWSTLARRGVVPPPGSAVFPTFASFAELEPKMEPRIRELLDKVTGFIINDRRMIPMASRFARPLIYSPDYTDPEVFYPDEGLRRQAGPLRIGWAGSVKYWGTIKHVVEIEQACAELGEKVEFIRQDREKDSWRDERQMAQWFNSLDLYVSANIPRTPTPVPIIEALACGVPVITTRCGELWPLLEIIDPSLIINSPTVRDIKRALAYCVALGRGQLLALGRRLRQWMAKDFLTWESGEATRITHVLIERSRQCVP